MSLILELFIFMISFWLLSEFSEGFKIKGLKALFISSLVYVVCLIFFKVLFIVLFSIFTLGMLPFLKTISYAVAALTAFSIVVENVNGSKLPFKAIIFGVVFVTVCSSLLRVIMG